MRQVTTPSVNAQQSTKESFATGQPIIALQCHVETVEFVIQMTLMTATHVNACQVSVLRDYCLTVCLSVCPSARLFLKKKSESLQNITFLFSFASSSFESMDLSNIFPPESVCHSIFFHVEVQIFFPFELVIK